MDAMCQFFGERTTERNNKKSKKCAWQLRVVKICMGWSKRSKSPSLGEKSSTSETCWIFYCMDEQLLTWTKC